MLRDMLTFAASNVDRAFGAAMLRGKSSDSARAESLGHAERMLALAEIAASYARPEHFEPAGGFFADPGAIDPAWRPVRRIDGGQVVDWTWPSRFAPLRPEVTQRYLEHAPNRTATARMFLHGDRPRPVALLIHGYRCGQFALEERVWPIDWLFGRGLDLAIPVLPFHAVRAKAGPPVWPGSDPRVTNEGFRQAVFDLQALVGHLLDRGAPSVGAMGMSLGGYMSSLLGTVDARLAFVVPLIPLASFAHVARESGRLVGTRDEKAAQFEAIEAAHRAVSPVGRPARVAADRVLVVGAAGDRITPLDHARLIADHYRTPLHELTGGHLLQFWRADAFRATGKLLGRLGIFERER